MNSIKLIASDLDSTLLDSSMGLSRENSRAITAIWEKGIYFVPATGRPLYAIPASVREHPDIKYIISSNGAVITDIPTGAAITSCFTKEVSRRMFSILDTYDTVTMVHYRGNSIVDLDGDSEENYIRHNVNRYYRSFISELNLKVPNFKDYCLSMDDEVEMASVFFTEQEKKEECMKQLSEIEGLRVISPSRFNLEMFSEKTNKGAALCRLCRELGISVADTVGVGDSANDIPLLTSSGHGLAVSNAKEELTAVCDAVICSNDEHIARYLYENHIK